MTFAKKLTDTDVISIRAEYCFNEPSASLRALARRYHVSYQTILHAVRYLTYKRPEGECHGRPASSRPCSEISQRNAHARVANAPRTAAAADRSVHHSADVNSRLP